MFHFATKLDTRDDFGAHSLLIARIMLYKNIKLIYQDK